VGLSQWGILSSVAWFSHARADAKYGYIRAGIKAGMEIGLVALRKTEILSPRSVYPDSANSTMPNLKAN
jgi:hypothetical protein